MTAHGRPGARETIRPLRTLARRITLTLSLIPAVVLIGPSPAMAGDVPAGPPAGVDMMLKPPATGKIRVAFVIGPRATVIDFTGPWEVFQDVHIDGRGTTHDDMMPFELFTVADSTDPIVATGGLRIVPDYAFADAPQPHVIVVPAVKRSDAMLEWLRRASPKADVTMSVCTGAFILGHAGLLEGKKATTHHDFFGEFEKAFPGVTLHRGRRFVENPGVSSAGGLTSGIDLALRVVARYFGRETADRTARYMEYEGTGWIEGKARVPADR